MDIFNFEDADGKKFSVKLKHFSQQGKVYEVEIRGFGSTATFADILESVWLSGKLEGMRKIEDDRR